LRTNEIIEIENIDAKNGSGKHRRIQKRKQRKNDARPESMLRIAQKLRILKIISIN
jgi:hypothetical protein